MEGKSLAFEPGFLQERLVLAVVEVAGVYRLADPVWEHKAGVLPRRRGEYLGVLACLVHPQCCHRSLVEGHAAAAGPVLWGPKPRPFSVTLREQRTESLGDLTSRSTSVHFNPNSSPRLSPVWTARVYRASLRLPLAAISSALTWAGERALASSEPRWWLLRGRSPAATLRGIRSSRTACES